MNYFTQKRVLVTVIIIMVLLNFTVLALIFGFYRSVDNIQMVNPPSPPPPPPPPGIESVMAAELNLTGDQKIYFKQATERFLQHSQMIMEQYHQDKRMMFTLMAEPEPDTARIFKITGKLGEQQSRLERIMAAYFLELKQFCSPEQQERFPMIFQQMMERMNLAVPEEREIKGKD